jgi:hypothetical protein
MQNWPSWPIDHFWTIWEAFEVQLRKDWLLFEGSRV